MTDQKISLPWGESEINLNLPSDWKIIGIFDPASQPAVSESESRNRSRRLLIPFKLILYGK